MIDLWDPDNEAALHYAVTRLMNRYARGVDRKDWELVLECYHPGATDDHGLTRGTVYEFLDAFRGGQTEVTTCFHLCANLLLLEVDRETREALVETYCVGWQRLAEHAERVGPLFESPLLAPGSSTARLMSCGNRYLDLVSERGGELRIAQRVVIYEWVNVVPSDGQEQLAGRTLARRTPEDPSSTTLAAFRQQKVP